MGVAGYSDGHVLRNNRPNFLNPGPRLLRVSWHSRDLDGSDAGQFGDALTSGYEPQFDLDVDPEIIRSLAFTKNLPAAPLS